MRIINYNETQSYGVENNTQEVHSLIVDANFYYRQHKHRGTLQTSILPTQWIVCSENIQDIIDYISINSLKDINSISDIWHDDTATIQLIQTFEDSLQMLEDFPEIGMYRKQNNLIPIKENGYIYFYLNHLLDEHKTILENYNTQINTKPC